MPRTTTIPWIPLAILLVAIGAALLWRPWAQTAAPPATPESQPPAENAAPQTPPRAEATPTVYIAPPEVDERKTIKMPDGTRVLPLNGVENPAPVNWPADVPYTPIVGKITELGIDYYLHADGCRSTTMMVWRSDLGRMDPVTQVQFPKPILPIAPETTPRKL